jgi:hypothetical protein
MCLALRAAVTHIKSAGPFLTAQPYGTYRGHNLSDLHPSLAKQAEFMCSLFTVPTKLDQIYCSIQSVVNESGFRLSRRSMQSPYLITYHILLAVTYYSLSRLL